MEIIFISDYRIQILGQKILSALRSCSLFRVSQHKCRSSLNCNHRLIFFCMKICLDHVIFDVPLIIIDRRSYMSAFCNRYVPETFSSFSINIFRKSKGLQGSAKQLAQMPHVNRLHESKGRFGKDCDHPCYFLSVSKSHFQN